MSAFDIPDLVVKKAPPKQQPGKKQPRPPREQAEASPPKDGLTPPRTYNWRTPEYKPSPQMMRALERARESQPPVKSLAGSPVLTNTKDWL